MSRYRKIRDMLFKLWIKKQGVKNDKSERKENSLEMEPSAIFFQDINSVEVLKEKQKNYCQYCQFD